MHSGGIIIIICWYLIVIRFLYILGRNTMLFIMELQKMKPHVVRLFIVLSGRKKVEFLVAFNCALGAQRC